MNVTLLTPTKNRSEFVNRLLSYYLALAFEGYICIGDSSEGEELLRTRKIVENHQNDLHIIYGEYPGLSNSSCIAKMLDVVPTDYAALLPDDDFLVPEGLSNCTSFLDQHHDYVAAHGVGIVLSLETGQIQGSVARVGPYKLRPIEAETGAQRVRDHLSDYSVLLFSVHRIDTWRAMYRNVPSVPDPAFADELLPTSCAVALGKIKQLDGLYLVRQVHSDQYRHLGVFEWIINPHWRPSYEVFRDSVMEELVRQEGTAKQEAGEAIKEAFWAYMLRALNRSWSVQYPPDQRGIRSSARRAARSVPFLRRAWGQVRSLLHREASAVSLPALLRRSSPYHDDFMPVYRALTSVPSET